MLNISQTVFEHHQISRIPIPVRYVVSRGQTGDMNETKMQATLMSAIFCRKIRCKYTLDGNNVCNHFNKIS